MTDVNNMIKEYLIKNGYDGLYNGDWGCGCTINDLAPCGDNIINCNAGYKLSKEDAKEMGDYDTFIYSEKQLERGEGEELL